MVVAAIVGILAVMTTPYLFGTKEKNLLQAQADLLLRDLKIGQQNAIAAYKGYDYTISFNVGNNTYTLQPEIEPIVKPLFEGVSFEYASPSQITFEKLTGEPDERLYLSLETNRFTLHLKAYPDGLFRSLPPSKK